MSGILDIFRRRRPEAPPPGAVVPAAERLPVRAPPPPEAPSGLVEAIRALFAPPAEPPPPSGPIVRAAEVFAPPAVAPPEPSALERALQVFQLPPPPALPPETPPAAPPVPVPTVAEAFFPEPVEERPLEEVFTAMVPVVEPAPVTAAEAARAEWRRAVIEAMERQPPAWILRAPPPPPGPWKIPSADEMARLLLRRFEDLPRTLEELARFRRTPEFVMSLAESQHLGRPLMIAIGPVIYRELYDDIRRFFEIPEGVIDGYFRRTRTPEDEREAEARVWDEIASPLFFRVTEAMDLLKPRDLPGWFTVTFDEATGRYWIYYVEALVVPVPRPPYMLPYVPGLPGPRGAA